MPSVSLSFKVHFPYRLLKTAPDFSGNQIDFFDTDANRFAADKLADECYLPANEILLSKIEEHQGDFKVAFAISGTAVEILQEFRPDVIRSFRQLAETGCVEFFAETYYHSLSWLYSKKEFGRQVEKHHELIKNIFGLEPRVLRNTELIYNNELARYVAALGYQGILCEGIERILRGRSVNRVYAAPENGDFGLLLRNRNMSDDIAFRFDDPQWSEHPLTADKFAGWFHKQSGNADNVNLFFDYETFGVHKKQSTGILAFLEYLPEEVLKNENWEFLTPAGVLEKNYPRDIYNAPESTSWENMESASCVWNDNMMQNNTLRKIYSIEPMVKSSTIPGALERWGRLQSADHFYYMCNDSRSVSEIHRLLNPFPSAKDAYENYCNAVTMFELTLIQQELKETMRNKSRSGYARHLLIL